MAGVGRTPKAAAARVGHEVPERGEWQASPGTGWRHGEIPACPLRAKAAVETWASWMASPSAAHWGTEDLPHLRLLLGLWAKVNAGIANREQHTLYQRLADDLGITFKGRQDRRWLEAQPPAADDEPADEAPALRVVGGSGA